MSAKSRIVSFSMDSELCARFDAWIAHEGFPSRSAGLQRLVREQLESGGGGDALGLAMATVTFVYDHHQRELLERLTHLQHQNLDLVVSSTHVHLDHSRCLEVLILRGPGQAVGDLARALSNTRGVERARVSLLPVSEPVASAEPGHEHEGPAWHTHAHGAASGAESGDPASQGQERKRGGSGEG